MWAAQDDFLYHGASPRAFVHLDIYISNKSSIIYRKDIEIKKAWAIKI